MLVANISQSQRRNHLGPPPVRKCQAKLRKLEIGTKMERSQGMGRFG